nr:hypothetical protein [Tanacetum cinerariifolium]
QRLQQLLLSLQAEQAHLLAGPSWIRDWLGLTQVNPSECRTTVQPTFAALPDGQQFAQLHRQLIQYDALRAEFAASGVPALSLEGNATAPELQRLDWAHVRDFVMHQQQLQELVLRWQILVPRLALPTAADFDTLAQAYGQYQEVLAYIAQEGEVRTSLCKALPGWPTELHLDAPTAIAEAVAVVQRHLTRLGLRGVHAVRTAAQAALEHTAGNLTLALRLVLRDYVGNSAADEVELQKTWSELLSELHHAQGRETAFNERAALAQERLITLF